MCISFKIVSTIFSPLYFIYILELACKFIQQKVCWIMTETALSIYQFWENLKMYMIYSQATS